MHAKEIKVFFSLFPKFFSSRHLFACLCLSSLKVAGAIRADTRARMREKRVLLSFFPLPLFWGTDVRRAEKCLNPGLVERGGGIRAVKSS